MLKRYRTPPAPPATAETFAYDADDPRDLFGVPFDAWRDNDDTDVSGPMRLFRSAVPHFRRNGKGAFVAISGIEALQPRLPYPLGPYRPALHGFVKLLSDRHGREGIRVDCIAPGLMENAAAEFPEGWLNTVPAGRYGAVGEIAGTGAFLLSDDAGFVTGQTIVADGGVDRTAGTLLRATALSVPPLQAPA